MNLLALHSLATNVKDLSKKINVSEENLPKFGYSRDNGLPSVEVDSKGYHFLIIERGSEIERKTTEELKQILYWIFEAITFSMALKYELDNRDPTQDSRIILFEKQIQLMASVEEEFAAQLRKGHRSNLEICTLYKTSRFLTSQKYDCSVDYC